MLLILLSFALRIFRLGYQSFWHDEGVSFYIASRELAGLLRTVAGSDHPPFYFLLLHFWMKLVGTGEFALRFLSLWFSTATVPLIYLLGKKVSHREIGLLGAFVLAISPFHIWYAQETRGYTLLVFLTLLSSYLLGLAWEKVRWTVWAAYALVSIAALYTHFYAFFILASQGIYVLVRILTRADGRLLKRPWKEWIVATAFAGMAFLPWLPPTLNQYGTNLTYWRGVLDIKKALLDSGLAFAVGSSLEGKLAVGAAMLSSLLALLGAGGKLVDLKPERSRFFNGLFLILYLLLPGVLLFLLIYARPKFAPRYLLAVTPPFYLFVAEGIWRLGRKQRPLWPLLMGVVAISPLISLRNYYFLPQYARDDFRSVVAYIDAHAEEGDAVLIVGGHAFPTFVYYDRKKLPFYPVPPGILPVVGDGVDNAYVADVLNGLVERHRRLWLILWQEELADPRRLVLNYLISYGIRLPVGLDVKRPSLLLFSLEHKPRFPVQPPVPYVLGIPFADNLELVGYDLTKGGWRRDITRQEPWGRSLQGERLAFRPGETIYLALYWRATGPVSRDYTAFTHLISPQGVVYGEMDRRLGGDFYPSSKWPVGEIIEQEYPLPVAPDTPPGLYSIEVGLYFFETMERLPVLDEAGEPRADRVIIGPVEISP